MLRKRFSALFFCPLFKRLFLPFRASHPPTSAFFLLSYAYRVRSFISRDDLSPRACSLRFLTPGTCATKWAVVLTSI